ncbi:hypothetical protein TNCV_2878071 [Trichonephila clavipes]|uniref:Uncharacterized protein n=1 Tax=Trichonephila clavipes TaxID=2585209 RepID=A0A8X7BC48_TRICX|nr:hypothetical protein TNCV_2878071 [Trichonephila clavipes]
MRDVEIEFETQKKLIELEGEGHFAKACLDIEVSIDRGNIGNEVRSDFSSETRLKVEVEDRLKADKEAKAAEEGQKMEERKNSFGKRNEIEERKMACGRADVAYSRGTQNEHERRTEVVTRRKM